MIGQKNAKKLHDRYSVTALQFSQPYFLAKKNFYIYIYINIEFNFDLLAIVLRTVTL